MSTLVIGEEPSTPLMARSTSATSRTSAAVSSSSSSRPSSRGASSTTASSSSSSRPSSSKAASSTTATTIAKSEPGKYWPTWQHVTQKLMISRIRYRTIHNNSCSLSAHPPCYRRDHHRLQHIFTRVYQVFRTKRGRHTLQVPHIAIQSRHEMYDYHNSNSRT